MKATAKPVNLGARERLIEAAGQIFGEQGYHGATVREITREAGMNLASINYYFRDKEELYWEVLQHAVQASLKNDKETVADLAAEDQLGLFIVGFLRNLLDPARPDWHGKLIARELGAPTRLLDVLVESTIRPKGETLRKILRRLWDGKLPAEKEALLCASIMGQCLYYRQNRAVVERMYPELLQEGNAIQRLGRHITEFSLTAIKGLKNG